jgi:hypothetical protein
LALDFLESSLRNNITNHGKRVALIALRLGEELRLSSEDMFDLYAAAMLHDNGMTHEVYSAIDTKKLPWGKPGLTASLASATSRHFLFEEQRGCDTVSP